MSFARKNDASIYHRRVFYVQAAISIMASHVYVITRHHFNVSTVADPGCRLNPTFDPASVLPFRRNWAKGSRLAFLESKILPYKDARHKSKSAADDYADQVVNEFCAIYPYDAPMDQELAADQPPVERCLDISLTQFERDKKAALISRLRTVQSDFSISSEFCLMLYLFRVFAISSSLAGPKPRPSPR